MIENARGFKGDKTIMTTKIEEDDRGNTILSEYNAQGVCLRVKIVKWATEK